MGTENFVSQFQTKVLRQSKDLDEYSLYQAALEWDLIDPIVIEDRNDLKSEYRWRDRVDPYHHQVTNLITFCRRLPVTLLADDVGLGKTISAGLVASELISRGRLTKIFIVCPKILCAQWKEELENKFDIPALVATGQDLIKAKPPGENGAVITTYNSARLHLDKIEKVGYEMLILDEAHKLRNLYGTETTPQVAIRFRKALSERLFKYVLMLTATPIHNRLWDIYSLIDLLTVARGHENPFGKEGVFARKFIDGDKSQARRLKAESRQEFRDIVYGYMSRIRRADTNLSFPERAIQLHLVDPTPEEIELFELIKEPILEVNFLSQVTILQALVSSPEALLRVLETMRINKTIPKNLDIESVKEVISRIKITSKLQGLGILVDKLKQEKPLDWRVVIFTTRRETQTTIQNFLELRGISCGLINGDSATRNQTTIDDFKGDNPKVNVIISTEAGSEGVNLQVANVLVNYDLPWNPMIVEQRIGRIQRLNSKFARVSIFNIVLRGTFEERIVGRLIEKLQMASHAIGDIEALLEAAGLDEDDSDANGFADKIGKLVVASLTGSDVTEDTRRIEKSIEEAKLKLEQEEKNINSLLGGMNGSEDAGPKCPKLPNQERSMNVPTFVLEALKFTGATVESENGFYSSTTGKKKEVIRFVGDKINPDLATTLYAPGASAFERLVSDISNRDLHYVKDRDANALNSAEQISEKWVSDFSAKILNMHVSEVFRCYEGTALIRVRATVACDSYERLVEVQCAPEDHSIVLTRFGLDALPQLIDKVGDVGVVTEHLVEKSLHDEGIREFSRFYTERRTQELIAAGEDPRKRKKIEDDFTPRLEMTLVGLKGLVHRQLKLALSYEIDSEAYTSSILITPYKNSVDTAPQLIKCDKTGNIAPEECFAVCEISGLRVLRHLLRSSDVSKRFALPEHIVVCSLSGKHVLSDEVEKSSVTGGFVVKSLLKMSAVSGKKAEPKFFGKCEFTDLELLDTELAISQVSGKHYRIDEELRSVVSGKTGHKQEFILCAESNQPLLLSESEKCDISGKIVIPGLLEVCAISGKKVLPIELEKSSISGKKALKKFFVASTISGARFPDIEGIKSVIGNFCAPLETKKCSWDGNMYHPEDLRNCKLTGLLVHFRYLTVDGLYLDSLVNLLDGTSRKLEKQDLWTQILSRSFAVFGSHKCKIQASELSPDQKHLAVCVEVKTWGGFKTRYAGAIYSLNDDSIVGRVVFGKREELRWVKD